MWDRNLAIWRRSILFRMGNRNIFSLFNFNIGLIKIAIPFIKYIRLYLYSQLVGMVNFNQNFIITLNFNMEPELRGNAPKQSIYKAGDDQPRGFKPVIPIVQPAFPAGDKRPSPFSESDLPLDLKANACFQEYIKLIQENKNIKTTIDHVNRQKLQLQQKINSLLYLEKEDAENKKKRHRRNAHEIVRSFQCPVENCDKRYGAEASLTQHIKLKHEIYYGTPEFEKFVQDLSKKHKQQSNQ